MVMLLMGLTLNKDVIIAAIKNWKVALLGTAPQFLLMPLIAYILGILFPLSP
jgi:predicted Na+-dependent transporter